MVDCPGFGTATTKVVLRSNQTLTIPLAISKQQTSITVSAEGNRLDTSNESQASLLRLNTKQLSSLPIEDDDVIGAMSRLINPSGGQAATIVVDGMERTDSITLKPSMIKELRINNNGYSAQFPRSGKDRIEIETAAGTDTLHGSFLFRDRDAIFDARNPFSLSKPFLLAAGF